MKAMRANCARWLTLYRKPTAFVRELARAERMT